MSEWANEWISSNNKILNYEDKLVDRLDDVHWANNGE